MKLPSIESKNHPLFNCGNPDCPICSKAYSFMKIKDKVTNLKKKFMTESVAPFIGRFNYPDLNIGILAPPEHETDAWMYDAPKYWAHKNFRLSKIIDFRFSLINSKSHFNIKRNNRLIGINQEIALSSKPVDIEIHLRDKPQLNINFDNFIAPQGPTAKLDKVFLAENPHIHTKVEKVYSDTDLKANQAITYLYDNNFDENFLSRILSVGTLGIGKNRKLVPTRWSITATDDTLGKHLHDKIIDYPEIDYSAFFGGYLGNYYLILCFPDIWSYELFEMHIDNPEHFMTDHEFHKGRKYYARNTAGGYYTVKLAILEKLNDLKRQASCIALRFITGDYTLPLGVWVTREAARNAMKNKIEFSSKELMLKYAEKLIHKKFNLDVNTYLNKSLLLRELKDQKKLSAFI